MSTIRSRTRDERGATVVLVALLALVLFAAGAVAVDMGQVYAKRSALQSNVDLAVMAAAAELDNSGACNPEVVTVATEYLLKAGNAVDGQYAVNLVSADKQDGYITCNNWRVDLWAPAARADFGMAKSVGIDGVDVPAYAAAQIKSPGMSSSMPMYAVSGCDSGTQIIADPPPGHTVTAVPDLSPDSATHNTATFTISPAEIPSADPNETMTITGTGLDGVTKVTFTMAGGPPDHHEVTAITVITPGSKLSVSVPSAVLNKDGVWWVRVVKPDGVGGDQYSTEANAETFIVGDVLFCDGSVSGNFGTIRVARSDSPSGKWVEYNMIRGLQPRLVKHPTMTSGDCKNKPGSVVSDTSPVNGTNCVWTDPGFAGPDAYDGLVTGPSGPGRLNKNTTPGCSRTGTNSRTATSPALNDDLLTCFLLDTSTKIQDLVDGKPKVISADVYSSPRFFQIPLFPTEATNGASQHYPIIGFIPGFITDQPVWASRATPGTVSSWNGLDISGSKVERLHVVLFDPASLPDTAPPVGGEIDYLGFGPKVVVLVE